MDNLNASNGTVKILGASGANAYTLTWQWPTPNNSNTTNYYLSFDLYCELCDTGGPVSYAVRYSGQSGAPTDSGTVGAGEAAIFQGIRVAPGQYITFSTSVTGSNGDGSSFTISNFNASVPGPLPATGAATAFGFSRRLRRRIKGELPPGSRKPTTSTHPSSYLNLSPTALHGLPATFSYTAMPHRPTLANSLPTRLGLQAMPPAPALEPADNDIAAMQG